MPKVGKPIFVRLANSMVCKILMIKAWGVGLLANAIVSILEKDDDLVVFITNSTVAYAKKSMWHGTLSVKNMGLPR